MSLASRFFAQFDAFSAPPLLRARKQPQTSSYTSGILSFLMALLFTYVFMAGVYNVLTYSKIDSMQTETKLSGEQVKADNILFAVRVGYQTINDSLELFNIGAYALAEDGSNLTINLQPCKVQSFARIGDDSEYQYNEYSLSDFFCPNSTQFLNIKKVYYAPNSTSITIFVRPCQNGLYCKNSSQQAQMVKDIQQKQGAIFLLVYFLDSLLFPNERYPVRYTINTDVQLAFTMKRGIIGTIQLGSYQVDTDVSYFPVTQEQSNAGNFVNSFRETSFERQNDTANYAFIYISMNRKFIKIQRTVGKFDQLLSYAGGLFSIIVGALSFFMYSYNQYRYELMVAEGVCNNDDNGNVIREQDFTFFKYIKYTIFDWVKILLCKQIQWKDCKLIDEAREEASSHLDVTNLFRKINSFQTAFQHLLDENEKDCLALLKPQSLNQTRRERMMLQYYSAVINGEPATTLQQYRTAQSLLQFSLKIYQKSMRSSKVINTDVLNDVPHLNRNGVASYREKQQTTDQIIQLFPDIIHSAQGVQLSPDMEQVQVQLCDAYYNLPQNKKSKFQSNIPIKILIRLRNRRMKMQQSNDQQKNQGDSLSSCSVAKF